MSRLIVSEVLVVAVTFLVRDLDGGAAQGVNMCNREEMIGLLVHNCRRVNFGTFVYMSESNILSISYCSQFARLSGNLSKYARFFCLLVLFHLNLQPPRSFTAFNQYLLFR